MKTKKPAARLIGVREMTQLFGDFSDSQLKQLHGKLGKILEERELLNNTRFVPKRKRVSKAA